jgi:hypothetical protein
MPPLFSHIDGQLLQVVFLFPPPTKSQKVSALVCHNDSKSSACILRLI